MGMSIDVGRCAYNESINSLYFDCPPGIDYCCDVVGYASLESDITARECCQFDSYSNQHWLTLCIIQSLSILNIVLFAVLCSICVYILLSEMMTSSPLEQQRQPKVRANRNIGLRGLILSQMLQEQGQQDSFVLSSIKSRKQRTTKVTAQQARLSVVPKT